MQGAAAVDELPSNQHKLTYAQIYKLDQILKGTVTICSRENYPPIEITLKKLMLTVRYNLEAPPYMGGAGLQVKGIRLHGGAASHVMADKDQNYSDIDLIFRISFKSDIHFKLAKMAVYRTLWDLLRAATPNSLVFPWSYVCKMFMVDDSGDRWSLIALGNSKLFRVVELKFLDTMNRQFEFSVDSFQIDLVPMLSFYDSTLSFNRSFIPNVVAECVFGSIREALYHLNKKYICTYRPEFIRGGGLLKYCHLIARKFKIIDKRYFSELEVLMCNRFFLDFPRPELQRAKIEAYIRDHFWNMGGETIPQRSMSTLFRVIKRSAHGGMKCQSQSVLNIVQDIVKGMKEWRRAKAQRERELQPELAKQKAKRKPKQKPRGRRQPPQPRGRRVVFWDHNDLQTNDNGGNGGGGDANQYMVYMDLDGSNEVHSIPFRNRRRNQNMESEGDASFNPSAMPQDMPHYMQQDMPQYMQQDIPQYMEEDNSYHEGQFPYSDTQQMPDDQWNYDYNYPEPMEEEQSGGAYAEQVPTQENPYLQQSEQPHYQHNPNHYGNSTFLEDGLENYSAINSESIQEDANLNANHWEEPAYAPEQFQGDAVHDQPPTTEGYQPAYTNDAPAAFPTPPQDEPTPPTIVPWVPPLPYGYPTNTSTEQPVPYYYIPWSANPMSYATPQGGQWIPIYYLNPPVNENQSLPTLQNNQSAALPQQMLNNQMVYATPTQGAPLPTYGSVQTPTNAIANVTPSQDGQLVAYNNQQMLANQSAYAIPTPVANQAASGTPLYYYYYFPTANPTTPEPPTQSNQVGEYNPQQVSTNPIVYPHATQEGQLNTLNAEPTPTNQMVYTPFQGGHLIPYNLQQMPTGQSPQQINPVIFTPLPQNGHFVTNDSQQAAPSEQNINYPQTQTPLNQNVYYPQIQLPVNENINNPQIQTPLNQNVYYPQIQTLSNQNINYQQAQTPSNEIVNYPQVQTPANQTIHYPQVQTSLNQNIYYPQMQSPANENINNPQVQTPLNQNIYYPQTQQPSPMIQHDGNNSYPNPPLQPMEVITNYPEQQRVQPTVSPALASPYSTQLNLPVSQEAHNNAADNSAPVPVSQEAQPVVMLYYYPQQTNHFTNEQLANPSVGPMPQANPVMNAGGHQLISYYPLQRYTSTAPHHIDQTQIPVQYQQ